VKRQRIVDGCLDPEVPGDISGAAMELSPAYAAARAPFRFHDREGGERTASPQQSAAERDGERALVRAIRQREPRTGERLYDQVIDAVDRSIARILGAGQPEHDDLVQATFEQLVVTLMDGTFRHECGLRSWAVSIASHLALNAIRSRSRERAVFDHGREIDDRIGPSGGASVERVVETRRTLAQMRNVLATMNPERARALVLFHVLEYDLKQVAGALGVSVAAAQSRVVRGRRELLARMERRPVEDGDG
jgi:RNA polymerase sigma-70 factor (ECF subfamily)